MESGSKEGGEIVGRQGEGANRDVSPSDARFAYSLDLYLHGLYGV